MLRRLSPAYAFESVTHLFGRKHGQSRVPHHNNAHYPSPIRNHTDVVSSMPTAEPLSSRESEKRQTK